VEMYGNGVRIISMKATKEHLRMDRHGLETRLQTQSVVVEASVALFADAALQHAMPVTLIYTTTSSV
jgi:hypothetical protein